MDQTNMYLCFEAKDGKNNHVYLIYSVKLGDLWDDSGSPPRFTCEASIDGVPSMGCGIFGSKIVLAGGLVKEDNRKYETKYRGLKTYDITTKEVSTDYIPIMRGGKVKPLVFELNNKLYVLDTNKGLSPRSFEVYYPNQKKWHQVLNPYYCPTPYVFAGLSRYSWYVFGKCVCISLSTKVGLTFLHHAKDMFKSFRGCFNAPLPFHGMAITYCQEGFKDTVVISFSKGIVEGRRLRTSYSGSYDEPVLIFDTKDCTKYDGEMSGFFADFGKGSFCLTAFDNAKIHIYTFKISRRQDKKGDKLKLRLLKNNLHEYDIADFNFNTLEPLTNFSFGGCFASSRAGPSKETIEADLYRSHFPLFDDEEEDDDIAGIECIHGSEDEDDDPYDPDFDL